MRAELRGGSTAKQIRHCASLRARPARSLEHQATVRALRTDPDTRAYMARRTAEGESHRDAKRCLRRVIARQLYRLLERYDQPGVEILRAA